MPGRHKKRGGGGRAKRNAEADARFERFVQGFPVDAVDGVDDSGGGVVHAGDVVNPEKMSEPCDQIETSKMVKVKSSSFGDWIHTFNNKNEFPDLDFVIPGLDEVLHLHRGRLGIASRAIAADLHARENLHGQFDENSHRIEWPHEKMVTNKTYRDVLVKWLRFCYGEDQTFIVDECPAAFVVLLQLKINDDAKLKSKLTQFMIDVATEDVSAGVKLLQECAITYNEFVDNDMDSFRDAIAKSVLKQNNIENHYDIVSECLLKLPHHYLDLVEYGSEHSAKSEFSIRLDYVRFNRDRMDDEMKLVFLKRCNLSELNSEEVKQIQDAHIMKDDKVIEFYQTVLEETQRMLEQERRENKKLKKRIEEIDEEYGDEGSEEDDEEEERKQQEEEKKQQMKEQALRDGGDLLKKNPLLKTERTVFHRSIEDVRQFCALLKGNAIPTRILLLGCMNIGAGVAELNEALKTNTTVTELELSHNNLGDAGVRVLCECLMINSTLTGLNLHDNLIGDWGAGGISEVLKVNTTLTKLNLSNNRIGDGAEMIRQSLEKNTTLTELIGFNNPFLNTTTGTLIGESIWRNYALAHPQTETSAVGQQCADLNGGNSNGWWCSIQ